MGETLEQRVMEVLRQVKFPGMSRDVVSFGFVRGVEADGGRVVVDLRVPTGNPGAAERIREEVERSLQGIEGCDELEVRLEVVQPQRPEQAQQKAIARDPRLLAGVGAIVAVASGKGGVGKSTVAANLAVRLGQMGHRVGLLDADIYGPSMPLMFGIDARPRVIENRLLPFEKYGIVLMSLGFVLDVDTPVIWRGPMVMKALEQLLGDVEWGELDYLIVDLPPGTGDAQLTLTQKVPLSGAVIVSTPQDVALIDARKGLAMFHKVNVPVIGIVENMSMFVCPHCGETTEVFKHGGAERTAEALQVPFLGRIPLDPEIVAGGDAGTPIVVARPDGPHAEAFGEIARRVVEATAALAPHSLTIV
ncbi:MAG TPA: Mrp/NBP35 family ATP-binding protein [Thermoanaerobaculia bacterium]|nr:Mrp/NBP35 family ATP-binding protein [Thermoanaerobaculia bacterium]